MAPAYHPEWLVTFWLTTPILNWLNPHYVLILLAVGLLVRHYMKKQAPNEDAAPDHEDQRFKHLLLKKNVIEEQIGGLEGKFKKTEISEEEYKRKLKDYQAHLEQVEIELQQYTL